MRSTCFASCIRKSAWNVTFGNLKTGGSSRLPRNRSNVERTAGCESSMKSSAAATDGGGAFRYRRRPFERRKFCEWLLFYTDIVFDESHAGDVPRDRFGALFFGSGVDETAELDRTFESF